MDARNGGAAGRRPPSDHVARAARPDIRGLVDGGDEDLSVAVAPRQIIVRLPDRTQKSVVRAIDRLERAPANIFATMKSLTCDNGCGFLDSASIGRSALRRGTSASILYFAHPYSAFERAANENANRLIRGFIPKSADIGDYALKQIQAVEDWMNNLPRELLGGKTVVEAQQEKLNKRAA